MKHAKKIIMIPEVEYLALLSMMKNDDPLKTEKALINAKIHQNLTNKKISEDVKAKKYDWLLKQKRKLRELIEGKPQRVVVENLPPPPNVPPYMGINQTQPNLEESAQKTPKRRALRRRELTTSRSAASVPTTMDTSERETSGSSFENRSEYDTPKSIQNKVQQRTSLQAAPSQATTSSSVLQNESTKSPSPITPKSFTKLMNFVAKNKEKYGITKDGSILTNFNKPVGGSNYVDTLKYMAGQLSTPPKGSTFLKTKLTKDPEFIRVFGQIGKGKKIKKLVVVKINPIKTPGLKRNIINSFKPRIWAKL